MKENSRKGWLLFLSGDLNLALPLESLLRLVEAGSWGGRRSAAAKGKIVEVTLTIRRDRDSILTRAPPPVKVDDFNVQEKMEPVGMGLPFGRPFGHEQ